MAKKQRTHNNQTSSENQTENEAQEDMDEETVSETPQQDDVYQVVFTGEMTMGEIVSHATNPASEPQPVVEEVAPDPAPVVEEIAPEPSPVVEYAPVIEPGDGTPEHYLASGQQYLLTNQPGLAKTAYETALDMFSQVNNADGVAKCKEMLGTVYIMSADYGRALGFYQDALTHKKNIQDKSGIVEVLQQLTLVSQLQGAKDMAREYNQQAKAYLEGVNA